MFLNAEKTKWCQDKEEIWGFGENSLIYELILTPFRISKAAFWISNWASEISKSAFWTSNAVFFKGSSYWDVKFSKLGLPRNFDVRYPTSPDWVSLSIWYLIVSFGEVFPEIIKSGSSKTGIFLFFELSKGLCIFLYHFFAFKIL